MAVRATIALAMPLVPPAREADYAAITEPLPVARVQHRPIHRSIGDASVPSQAKEGST